MTERASLEELKDFANKVRAAGGGNPIDALMPAVPVDSKKCLIARNLNFNCIVEPIGGDLAGPWIMRVETRKLRNAIAEALQLFTMTVDSTGRKGGKWGVVLPEPIAQVARDFDELTELLGDYRYIREYGYATDEDMKLLREFIPYVEASVLEAHGLADLVNEDGSITL